MRKKFLQVSPHGDYVQRSEIHEVFLMEGDKVKFTVFDTLDEELATKGQSGNFQGKFLHFCFSFP